jgi:thiol-disulfide isomerase/thioredoxin
MQSLFTIVLIIIFLIIISKIYNQCQTDTFTTNVISVYVFLSKTCPHCVDYDRTTHVSLANSLQSMNITLKRIYSDTDPDMFKKFNIEYVPTCVIDVNGNTVKLEGAITLENIKKQVDKMLTPIV